MISHPCHSGQDDTPKMQFSKPISPFGRQKSPNRPLIGQPILALGLNSMGLKLPQVEMKLLTLLMQICFSSASLTTQWIPLSSLSNELSYWRTKLRGSQSLKGRNTAVSNNSNRLPLRKRLKQLCGGSAGR